MKALVKRHWPLPLLIAVWAYKMEAFSQTMMLGLTALCIVAPVLAVVFGMGKR